MLNKIACGATVPDLSKTAMSRLGPIKSRQQAAWASGDFARVGSTLQIVGETLCEALDLRAGQRVLDVAAGNGNVALAAARRWGDAAAPLCEALDLRAGQRVLDVAAGNGNVALAAARRWCDVTATDYVPALLA